ncbi:MAG: hypothetical protein VX298_11330 [Pseudomonadota bacterium]|jgi:hypothetical protein|nr:hypothetical protein [Pseudomonadota bacterium]|tara:strand:+ start:2442 stop:2591 length:150 start_codon:yes stop_codon:yes gene_type:complete
MTGSDYQEGIVLPMGRKPVKSGPLKPAEQAQKDEAIPPFQQMLQEKHTA